MTAALATPPVTVLDAIYHRRAVRSYEPRLVPRATLEQLLDAAVQAPSAMNAQPWAFVVIQNRERLREYSNRAKALLPGIEHVADVRFDIFYDAGTLVVICGPKTGRYAQADCWLAAENFMLAAHALGLGTCPIGFAIPLLAQPDVRRELGIPEDLAAHAPIIVGVPRGTAAPVPRDPPRILTWSK